MTLIKSQHKEKTQVNGHPTVRYHQKTFFDASSILEKFAEFEFGVQEVNEILLSSMLVKDDEGYYKEIASIKF